MIFIVMLFTILKLCCESGRIAINSCKTFIVVLIILEVLFWILNRILPGNKDPERYSEWTEENPILIQGIFRVMLVSVIVFIMIYNISESRPLLSNTMLFLIFDAIADIACPIIFFNSYKKSKADLVKDAILYSIRLLRDAVLIAIIILLAIKVTIYGVILIAVGLCMVYLLYDKIFL